MTIFSTEFAVRKEIDRGQFAAQVIAWVKGMNASTLFDNKTALSEFSDEATVESPSGEKLTLKECSIGEGFIIGARHEMPDVDGRIWISEVTLASKDSISALRVRTQCAIVKGGAKAQTPKKPYFVKLAIEDGWPVEDGDFVLSQVPLFLNTGDVDLASKIVLGGVVSELPIVYISKRDDEKTIFSDKELNDLAFRLGGVAHVVVEPSRAFSKRLMMHAGGRNPYGGSLAVCVSGHGVVKRYFIGNLFADSEAISEAVYAFSSQYVTNRKPRIGVDWQNVIEESSRILRRQLDEGTLKLDKWLEAFDEKDNEKDKMIADLREQLDKLQEEYLETSKNESSISFKQIASLLGNELYKGEFVDRIRSILVLSLAADGVHPRTLEMCRRIVNGISWSGGADRLQSRLKVAGRDNSKADERIIEILLELGYEKRHSSGHPVCTPEKLFGLSSQTMSSSSSDHRAGKNASQRIIRDMGLDALRD